MHRNDGRRVHAHLCDAEPVSTSLFVHAYVCVHICDTGVDIEGADEPVSTGLLSDQEEGELLSWTALVLLAAEAAGITPAQRPQQDTADPTGSSSNRWGHAQHTNSHTDTTRSSMDRQGSAHVQSNMRQ